MASNPDSATVTPLVFGSNGDGNSFSTFAKCYLDVKKAKMVTKPGKTPKTVSDFFTKGGYDFMKEIEEEYNCASICKVPLFYITKDISEGKPEIECIRGIYNSIKGSMKVEAFFAILTALILLVAMISALVICCGPTSSMDDEDFDAIEYERK